MIVTFLGHRDFIYSEKIEERLVYAIEQCIKEGADEFFLGGYGSFDYFVAGVLRSLKSKNGHISIIFVTPYINKDYDSTLYDSSLYPPIENVPFKFAISERNKWMVQNADVVVSGVQRNFGGASKALVYARKLGKRIISLYDNVFE